MFKYGIGQVLRIKIGMYLGTTFTVEEDGVRMSADKYPRPQYRFIPVKHDETWYKNAIWYEEDEVEPAKEQK